MSRQRFGKLEAGAFSVEGDRDVPIHPGKMITDRSGMARALVGWPILITFRRAK